MRWNSGYLGQQSERMRDNGVRGIPESVELAIVTTIDDAPDLRWATTAEMALAIDGSSLIHVTWSRPDEGGDESSIEVESVALEGLVSVALHFNAGWLENKGWDDIARHPLGHAEIRFDQEAGFGHTLNVDIRGVDEDSAEAALITALLDYLKGRGGREI